MPRQTNVLTRERLTAEEVADLYEIAMEDGEINPVENDRILDAIEANIKVAKLREKAIRVATCAIETAAEGRRYRRAVRDFELTVIHGGLSEIGPGAA